MRKTLTALALAAAGAATMPFASAQTAPHNGWFVNGSVGRSALDEGAYNGHDTAYTINTGYRWELEPGGLLGFEVGYNDLGNIDVSNAFTDDPVLARGQSQLHGWTAGVNGHFNFNPNWYLSARAGIYSWKGHGLSNNDDPLRRSLSESDYYGGLGIGYDFSTAFGLGLNYDHYQAKASDVNLSTDVWSLGAEFRF
ncbi:MAG TPA: outer membrane beta-barrel protein [Rhodanobacteraceae bacterium]|nr:outer membrane beta-barrel protein [Rhodanobacteraceae bacterium]